MSRTKELMEQSERPGFRWRNIFVCGACLNDDGLASFVEAHPQSEKCDFCNNTDSRLVASLEDVINHIAECIRQDYVHPAEILPYETSGGGFIGSTFDGDEVLQDVGLDVSEKLFDAVAEALSEEPWASRYSYSFSPKTRLLTGWDNFKRTIKHSRRYTFWSADDKQEHAHDSIPAGNMLERVGDFIRKAKIIRVYQKDTCFWRVRVHDVDVHLKKDLHLSPPPIEKALQSNRMSPAGVVMFYGAKDFETACAETIVPSRTTGKQVTGGSFYSTRKLRLLNLVNLPKIPSYFDLSAEEHRLAIGFLHEFARDLAEPVKRDGSEHIEYVPTQAFTEYIRYELKSTKGSPIDGISYRSAVNGKPCYVLFCTQDECIAEPPSGHTQWLKFDAESLRTEDAQQTVESVRRNK